MKKQVKSEENGPGWYVKSNVEPLLVAVRKVRTRTDPKEFMKTKPEQRKNEWTEHRVSGQFARGMEDKVKNNTCRWMRKDDLKRCTKALTYSAQEYEWTISCAILTKLTVHPFAGFVVQEMRLYLI